eukprot:9069122-Alexandrium_andersonii.AAC.1
MMHPAVQAATFARRPAAGNVFPNVHDRATLSTGGRRPNGSCPRKGVRAPSLRDCGIATGSNPGTRAPPTEQCPGKTPDRSKRAPLTIGVWLKAQRGTACASRPSVCVCVRACARAS